MHQVWRKKEIHQYIEDNFHVLGVPLTEFDNISGLDKIDHSLLNNNIKIPETNLRVQL